MTLNGRGVNVAAVVLEHDQFLWAQQIKYLQSCQEVVSEILTGLKANIHSAHRQNGQS